MAIRFIAVLLCHPKIYSEAVSITSQGNNHHNPWGNSLVSAILLSTSWGRLFQAADPAELLCLSLYGSSSDLLHVSSFLGPRPEGQNLHGDSFSCGARQTRKLANSVTQTHLYPLLVWSLLTCKGVTWPSPKLKAWGSPV